MVDHENVEVSNLHRKIIHNKGRREMSKAISACNTMRSLNPTVFVTAVTDPLTWDKDMELVRGNYCVVDASDDPCTRYLINNACVLAERKPKTAAMTNGVRGKGGVPIPPVRCRAMVTEGETTVYNRQGVCVCVYQ